MAPFCIDCRSFFNVFGTIFGTIFLLAKQQNADFWHFGVGLHF